MGENWEVATYIVTMTSFSPFINTGPNGLVSVLNIFEDMGSCLLLLEVLLASVTLDYIYPQAMDRVHSRPKYFSAVSLACFMLKTMDKTANRYIRDQVAPRRLLHGNQHAYPAGRSLETALCQLITWSKRANSAGELDRRWGCYRYM